jgi:hypothetical protein
MDGPELMLAMALVVDALHLKAVRILRTEARIGVGSGERWRGFARSLRPNVGRPRSFELGRRWWLIRAAG